MPNDPSPVRFPPWGVDALPTADIRDIPRITSLDLLGASGQLVIMHDGREYRLRVTQNNKLILTA